MLPCLLWEGLFYFYFFNSLGCSTQIIMSSVGRDSHFFLPGAVLSDVLSNPTAPVEFPERATRVERDARFVSDLGERHLHWAVRDDVG